MWWWRSSSKIRANQLKGKHNTQRVLNRQLEVQGTRHVNLLFNFNPKSLKWPFIKWQWGTWPPCVICLVSHLWEAPASLLRYMCVLFYMLIRVNGQQFWKINMHVFVIFEILLPNPQSNLAVIVKSAEHYSRLALFLYGPSTTLPSFALSLLICWCIVGFINDDTDSDNNNNNNNNN